MPGKLILETKRLLLREFDEDDVEPYFLLGSEPAVIRFTGGSRMTSLDQALEVLRANPLADYRSRGYGRWACVRKENGAVIGAAGLKYLADLGEVDLGYRLLPVYWGVGLATEAARAILDYGFAQLGLERIIGLVDPENVASRRVLEKIGMENTGTSQYMGTTVVRYVRSSSSTGY